MFAAAEVRACRHDGSSTSQMQTRKSLPELEAELYAARMLLLNTYPSEVCSQLMDMYSKMVMHTTKHANEAQPPAQPATPTAVHADASMATESRVIADDGPSTSAPHDAAAGLSVSGWRLCFGTAAAEARFARWLTMHSVAGDDAGLGHVLLLSTLLQLLLCSATNDAPTALATYQPCLAWLAPLLLLSVPVHVTITYCPVWYRAHREFVCGCLRGTLLLSALVHTFSCWSAPVRTAHAPMLSCFLACMIAYPSVQFAVRWQSHVLLQLVQLAVLLVACPFLFQWSSSGDEFTIVVLLVFVCFGFFLPCALLHSAERRLRFLFAEAQRSA